MAASAHGCVVAQGFTVVPVKYSSTNKCQHYMYIKEHIVREADSTKPKNRTLFVLNVPPYCCQKSLKRVFSMCGKVQKVYLHSKPTASAPDEDLSKFFPNSTPAQGFRVAYIIFRNPGSVQKAQKLKYDSPLIMKEEDSHQVGLAKWCNDYSNERVNIQALQSDIDDFMSKFDRESKEAEERAKAEEGVPDDEGWVTVTRHGKNKAAPRTEANEKRVHSRDRKRKKAKELMNFYTFQIRESKRDQIATLRKKFEEDKQRIALMKASRKFKPY